MAIGTGSQPDRKTFWQLTLESFAGKPVKVTMASGAYMVGQLQDIGPVACRLMTDLGPTVLRYEQLRECEEAI